METTEDILERATALLASVADVPELPDDRLVGMLALTEQLGRQADRIRVAVATEVAHRSRHELGSEGLSWRLGQRRPGHLIEQIALVSGAESARRMRLGAVVTARRALDGHPLPPLFARVAEAFEAGSIGVEAAMQITRELEKVSGRCAPDDVLHAEAMLVESALTESADLVAVNARLWRDALDADGAQPRDDELRQRGHFHLGRERHGMTPFGGEADPIAAAKLRAMLNAYTAPGSTPAFVEDAAGSHGATAGALDDQRTTGQRNLDILLGVITAGMNSDDTVPRARATIVATVRAEDFESGRGVGWLDGVSEPVSSASVRELGCDADIRLLTFGLRGEVLALGRTRRLFSPAQRLALAVRDGGCIWPQCTAPPAWCDAHHVEWWQAGGATDVSNGALLCPAHHHLLHNSDFTLRMENGLPRLKPPQRLEPTGREWHVGRSRVSAPLRR
ncbi:HNH endonuclease signature motif containing protein [Parafrigoribacterium soli]|uniref:HNH endonuclease signature motif containing protein n=1 Tax=Parafrigoribacterium soli TaxID=3144663 RepID=UPI0032EC652A